MPVEIKELIIKATVSEKSDDSLSGSGESKKDKEAIDKDELVASCVDQVLKILERSNER